MSIFVRLSISFVVGSHPRPFFFTNSVSGFQKGYRYLKEHGCVQNALVLILRDTARCMDEKRPLSTGSLWAI